MTKQMLAEQNMTESARVRLDETVVQKKTDDQVALWLKLNSGLMTRKPVIVEPYESSRMKLRQEGVRGICYVIRRLTEEMRQTADIARDLEVGQTKLFKIEMYMNLKTQMLLV